MSLIKGASIIGASSVISQGFGALTILVLSSKFGMAEVGNYALSLSIVMIGAQFSLYGSHFLLPKVSDEQVGETIVFCFLQSWIVSAVYMFAVSFFFSLPLIAIYILVASYSMMVISEYMFLRHKNFNTLAIQRITVPLIVFLALFTSGKIDKFYTYWAIGHLVLIVLWLYYGIGFKQFKAKDFTLKTQFGVLKRNKEHLTRIGTAEVVANASLQLPTVLINYWFSPLVAGYFAVVNRFCLSPVLILGQSVRNYTFSKWSEDYRNNNFNFAEFKQVRLFLLGIASLTVAGIYIFYPLVTEYFGNQQWMESVTTSQLMLPYVFAMLAFVPLTVVELIFGTPNSFLRIQCEQLTIVFISFVILPLTYLDYSTSLLTFTVLTACRYFMVYMKINKNAVKLRDKQS
ncbi:MAG: lipopolysaccharide biosynthesis protein [Vibrio sp.]